MIKKPQGYDESWAFTGEAQSLPAGCYVCVIKGAHEVTSNDREQFVLLYDIAEGDHKGFFQSRFDADKAAGRDAKWRGVHKQYMDGSSLPFFKGLITSVEKSTPGFVFKFGVEGNEKSLIGKKFGAVMYREQFQAQDGSLKWATKIDQIRSLEGLKDAKVPEDKPYSPAAPAGTSAASAPFIGTPGPDGFVNIPDGIDNEELPFN